MMIFLILIVFLTIVGLLILHELGHFLVAKKFGVQVEEFGFGYPPRIFAKKIGQTIYSLNLLPFGAFVRIRGEEKRIRDQRSFSQKPIWQRILIVLGGVVSFWLIGFLIFSLLGATFGLRMSVSDDFSPADLKGRGEIIQGPEVQIIGLSPDSPGELAGLEPGDIVLKATYQLPFQKEVKNIKKVRELQEFTNQHLGKEISLTLKREEKILNIKVIPRPSPPPGQGPIGIVLTRVVKIKYPWFEAPWQGGLIVGQQTFQIPIVLGRVFLKAIQGEKVPGIRMMGIVGLGDLMTKALRTGVENFLMLVALISVWLAFFNILPVPALDGGKLLFLVIEGIRKKPVSQLIEQKITTFFFFILILLMIFITIKDIMRLL